jgi:hypothetical protein
MKYQVEVGVEAASGTQGKLQLVTIQLDGKLERVGLAPSRLTGVLQKLLKETSHQAGIIKLVM